MQTTALCAHELRTRQRMKPKEKAQELINKFISVNLSQVNELVDGIRIKLAKESALIVADQMLELGMLVDDDLSGKFYIYWREVKKEIEAFNTTDE